LRIERLLSRPLLDHPIETEETMTLLIAGIVVFLGVHSVAIVAPGWRERVIGRIGEPAWKGIYSLLSVVGFVLIVVGFDAARLHPVGIWAPPVWTRHLALLLMLPVFPLLLATYLPGRIQSTVRHPMLTAVKTWALAHLLANGNLADIILFGAFLAWAVADRISLKHRSAPAVPGAPAGRLNDLIAVVAGLGIYIAFVVAVHAWLFGVSPLGVQ
jgi:uncharacterized membrane protein